MLKKIEGEFAVGQKKFPISKLSPGVEELIYYCLSKIFRGSYILTEDSSCSYFKVTKNLKREKLIKVLRDYQYQFNEGLNNKKEYFARGDTCFIFNSAYKSLVRVDFWGEKIEGISLVDLVTKRKICDIYEIIFSKNNICVYRPELRFSNVIVYKNSRNSLFKFDFTDAPSFHTNLRLLDKFLTSIYEKKSNVFLVTDYRSRLVKFESRVTFLDASIYRGWQSESLNVVILSDFELFDTVVPRSPNLDKEWLNLQRFNIGDFVVHRNHGIAIYGGMKIMDFEGKNFEYLVLNYAQNDKLYVPMNQLGHISKFIGSSKVPQLTRLGTQNWQKVKNRARKAIKNIVCELLDLYATREIKNGFAFTKDTIAQKNLIDTFPFKETEDQNRAWDEIRLDMESEKSMDRILVGDVGFGKTELAIRAAFKAVQDGKQVAILAPTTILVEQHYSVFKQRLKDFAVEIDVLSRFKDEKSLYNILKKLEVGLLDIVIGTHRLLSKDVKFKDLGLLIIDEEQRFGVEQKEHLKFFRKEVDVLSMTATPIPRSLNMALSGIKGISILLQPPQGRKPIRTLLFEFDSQKIIDAVKKEIDRGGQVYIVHNHVQTIDTFTKDLQSKLKKARFVIGHGQMLPVKLSSVMRDFNEKKYDALVCSTIIENGLDMPNVNTIIIDDAHKFGLTQLHQLRGRVGRSEKESYCYLFYPKGKMLSEVASSRLETISSNQALGAGFAISTKDLELRGTGNILGRDQSGNINAIGYALYVRLLREEIKKLKVLI